MQAMLYASIRDCLTLSVMAHIVTVPRSSALTDPRQGVHAGGVLSGCS